MRVDVALLPAQRHSLEDSVCIVVDLLRASSTIVTLLGMGAREIVPAAGVKAARELRASLPGSLLSGETGGLPPPGFDYGNSPSEFQEVDLRGRSVILATSNGTRILNQVAAAPLVLVGALLNCSAVAQAAAREAERLGLGVCIICCGAHGGSVFALEDAIGAGAIVAALADRQADLPAAVLSDGAQAALAIYQRHAEDLASAIASSSHAGDLVE
ncbi:MAG TPA: 2-phosphosulfolactate phosphatase, partial [Dehalococcoidia bacterium]|nr:2-phosphosulfolactate phosphatase [Dehalococcoidia bacterium]